MMRQTPQWQQNANRHTTLVDPVVTIQELSRLKPLRSTRIDHALVFTSPQGGYETFLPPNRPTRTELATRRWTTVYEVDMGLHEAQLPLALPSANDAFLFEVVLSCSWQVVSPDAFVASGERDVPAMVQRLVEGVVRPVLRRYGMADSSVAEREAQEVLASVGPLGTGAGLQVRWGLQIRRDEDALEQERALRRIEFAQQMLDPEHALRMKQDELNAERALAQGRQQHWIAMQDQNLGHERRVLAGQQELELQAIEAKKIEYYTYYLERGGPSAMAFQLARRPEDTALVLQNLREDQLRAMRNQMDFALAALQGGLEEHQLEEPRRQAMRVFREVMAGIGPSGAPAVEAGPASSATPADAAPVGDGEQAPPAGGPANWGLTKSDDPAAPGSVPPRPPAPPAPSAPPADSGPVFGYGA
ncbi:PE-PGRS family protein [Kitasatospora sp. NPDC002227]|uniref:PE-PGRS family protein n=1 Tax=Kitasatospora sp. NPDC002227 TaxID=3154773 RepID=UPI00332115A7